MKLIKQKDHRAIFDFYRKTPPTLAEQYIKDPDSQTLSEKKRLVYESGIKERQMLERNLKLGDPILRRLSNLKKIKKGNI